MTVETGRTGRNLDFLLVPFTVLKDSGLFVNVIKVISSALFNELFKNIWIKPNGGDVDVFSMVFDSAVGYE